MKLDSQEKTTNYWQETDDALESRGDDLSDQSEQLEPDDPETAPDDELDPLTKQAETVNETAPDGEPESPVEQAEAVNWESSEYFLQEKSGLWFVGLAVVAAGLIVLAILMEAWSFVALVVVSVVALIIYVKRPPRLIHYSLDSKGIHIDERIYSYDNYRSFGVLKDGDQFSIVLIPKKRFSPGLSIYFAKEQGEAIVDAFGLRLPMQEVKLDVIDKLIRKLKI
jgi:hypothetical protein